VETKKLLGLAIGGGVLFMLMSRKKTAAADSGDSSTLTGEAIESALDRPTNVYQERAGAGPTPVNPAADTLKTVKMVTAIGATAAAFIPVAGPFISAGIAAAGAIASIIIGATAGKPLDYVNAILITEMPYGYTGRDNIPPAATIYALDKYGWLWHLNQVTECGWSWREVIAVNWKVFAMFPRGKESICKIQEIDPMPRSGDPAVLRGLFGNDIRFKLGNSTDPHGPWEGGEVSPIPGSPAMWAEIAGGYEPTKVSSAGWF
jgi:hypothetical protein